MDKPHQTKSVITKTGTNYFRAKNCDTGGCSPTAEFIVKRDTTAPTVAEITFSAESRAWSKDAIINPSVSNADISGTAFTRTCWTAAAPCNAGTTDADNMVPAPTADGQHKMCARVKNGVGLWSATDCTSGTFNLDTTPPSKPILIPSISYSYTGTFTISWPVSTDAASGSGVSYYYLAQSSDSGSNYSAANPSQVNSPAVSWSSSSALGQGAYRYTIRAYDAAGNISSAPAAGEYLGDVIVDKTAPAITSFSVSPLTANPAESFSFTRSASDAGGSGIKTYQIYRATFSSSNKCNDSDKTNCVWQDLGDVTSNNPNPGTYYYGIHVTDNAGNCITESAGADGKGGYCGGADDSVVRINFGLIKVTKISNNAPGTPTLISPPDGTWTNSRNFCVKVTDSDTNNDLTATFTINGVQKTGSTVKTGNNSCYDYTTMADTTATGVSWSVSVSDGTTSTSGGPWIAKIDTVAPSGANISWKIIPNRATYSADTLTTTNVSAKSVGTTTSNYPTIEVNYSDNSGGSGIQTPTIGTSLEPQASFKQGPFTACSKLFPQFTLNGIQYNTCSTTNSKLTFTVPWSEGVDNNKANAIVIPLNFIKDGAGNPATGSITITINNQAPIIR